MNCSTKTVTRYARRGIIRPLCLGEKSKRASGGYSEASVREALARAAV
ncbi:MAG: hypothetical protein K6G91_02175 [Kiritimatiellae bacterium]|nr:hypothetical protein [Kiritimatiellia bacterium]